MPIAVRRLRADDDRSRFRSGNVELDRFFQLYAGQNQFRHHIGTTYVAVADDIGGAAAAGPGVVLGFATVCASEIATPDLPAAARKRLPRYPLSVLRLARLAVDQGAQGRGVGSLLLRAVLTLAQQMAREIGCVGVVVDAKPDAVAFYQKLGFIALDARAGQLGARPEPAPMFLELGAIPRTPR